MLRSLRSKFLVLLLGVVAVALCGTIVLRQLMIRDFSHYIEGDTEDKIYWLLAELEGSYERQGGWEVQSQSQDVLWALTLGFEVRLFDAEGREITTTERAAAASSPRVRRRLAALSESRPPGKGEFLPYGLFLAGTQIGTLEVRPLQPARETLFVRRADRFLILSIAIVGGLAVIVSLLFSRRLTRPIKDLSLAAGDISTGKLDRRVEADRRDELGDLAGAFNRMASDLERHESLRRKLIADVAHELRTPLGAMRGELEAIIDGVLPNDEKRLQSLHDETGRLRRLVEAIEELNQAEASALSLVRRQVDLQPFLARIVERFEGQFRDKGVVLELRCDDGTHVYADPERLSQIVVNLLSNALKATAAGGRVGIGAAGADGHVRITVEDTGAGIRKEDLPYIFERFFRGPGGGLGIGLTIVKELVEAHQGRIEVASAPGGTKFTVWLPAEGRS
jgi:two-component system sensor histidine kinase BaeS